MYFLPPVVGKLEEKKNKGAVAVRQRKTKSPDKMESRNGSNKMESPTRVPKMRRRQK